MGGPPSSERDTGPSSHREAGTPPPSCCGVKTTRTSGAQPGGVPCGRPRVPPRTEMPQAAQVAL